MTKLMQVFKCNVCGNIVEMVHEGPGALVCCNQPMVSMEENTVEAAVEKHVPVIEKKENGYMVTVGSVAHPMQDVHYIEWIEVICDNKIYRQHLKPGETPEAFFVIEGNDVYARAYCNLHGLWKS